MTSSYTSGGQRVNRYWKRPKPRIYECNIRDAERFYKDSYSSYLQAKQLTPSYGNKGIEDEFATRWTMRRISTDVDTSTPYIDSIRRDTSSALSNDYKSYEDPGRPSFSRHESLIDRDADQRSSHRAKSMVQTRYEDESVEDLRDVEQRLERIKKLKEELGIQGDVPRDTSEYTSTSKSILKKSSRLSPSNNLSGDYSSVRAGSRARFNDSDGYESKYATQSDRSSRYSSKYGGDEANGDIASSSKSYSKYSMDDSNSYSANKSSRLEDKKYGLTEDSDSSFRPSRRANKYLAEEDDSSSLIKSSRRSNKYMDDESSSYSRSRPTKVENKYDASDDSYSFSSTRKAATKHDKLTSDNSDKTEDDDIVLNIRKKFPTSEEILERIKKMDEDL